MDMVYLVYLYAVAVGFVAAGVTGSMWALATGENPRFGLLLEPGLIAPLRALVVVASAPLLLLLVAWRFVGSTIAGMLLVAASLGWSFLQGTFILTQFFGIS
jgi:ABC-type nitrate/sulfonate/bicarbonate transport system permease component